MSKATGNTKTFVKHEGVSIVGYSVRAPNASSVPEFAQALRAGKDLTTSNTRYPAGHKGLPPRQGRIKDSDFSSFDAGFFGLSCKQAEAMDPLIRMLLEVSYEALLDAQVSIDGIRGSETGVYVGHVFSDHVSNKTSGFNKDKCGYEFVNGANSMAANRISFFYDFKGPSFAVDTACSSSLVALHYAVKDINDGIIDRAVVAGLSLTSNPNLNESCNKFKMLSPTGHCHVWDERANGFCRSDGVACIILERSPEGYATIVGTGVNSDGHTPEGITYPSASNQAKLLKGVLESSRRLKANDIVYHEAHGTGTVAGDRVELAALCEVYKHPIPIGSVKSNIGHAEAASGLMGIVKILLMMEEKCLYPNYGFGKSPHAPINDGRFKVLRNKEDWTPGPCSITNFGFGGTNACALLVPSNIPRVVSLANHKIASPFASSAHSHIPASHSMFYTRQKALGNHTAFPYTWNGSKWKESAHLAFVFNGQGSNWKHMGADLIEDNEIFRSTIERLEAKTSIPLIDYYRDGSKWLSKDYSALGIVSFQLGLLSILREQGVRAPDFFLGHSVGELVCPFVAGLATEEEVLKNAMARAKLSQMINPIMRLDVFENEPLDGFDFLMRVESVSENQSSRRQLFVKQTPKDSLKDPSVIESFSMHGQMVVVGCSATEVDDVIAKLGLRETRVACYNAPRSQTVSGATAEVDRLIEYIQIHRKDTFVRKIDTDNVAYHAIFMKVFREQLRSEFQDAMGRDVVSVALPSEWLSTSRNDFFDLDYLVENILHPVYFQDAIARLPKGCSVLEIGPSTILLSQIKRTRSDLELMGLVDRKAPSKTDQVLKDLRERFPEVKHEHKGDSQQILGRDSDDGFLSCEQRYPRLWGRNKEFHVSTWDEYELPERNAEACLIKYDLTKEPWSSLHDHIIRGQNLFPCAGFVHALWSGTSFRCNVEMLNFSIHTPLMIAPAAKFVEMRLHKAGNHYELWDEYEKIQYASATVRVVKSAPVVYPAPESKADEHQCLIEGSKFYPDIRRLGYEFGSKYQLITHIDCEKAYFKNDCSNWISYIDAMIQSRLFNEDCLCYPLGFNRVRFSQNALSDAPRWVICPEENSFANDAVLLEGLRMEYLFSRNNNPYTMYKEVFVEYGESDDKIDINLLASLIVRESLTFKLNEPLASSELVQLSKLLNESDIIQDQSSTSVVISDSSDVKDVSLLVTIDPQEPTLPFKLVARWGNIRVYRCGWGHSELDTVSDWKDAVKLNEPFVWKGRGSSGAIASLVCETKERIKALSYESADKKCEIFGLDKRMRHNYITENGLHGIFVDKVINDNEEKKPSASACLQIYRPGHLSSLTWEEIDPTHYPIEVSVAALNFRDVMRSFGRLKEKNMALGLEFSGYNKLTKKRVFGMGQNCIASHCVPYYSFETPANFSDEEASTVAAVYLTAYYALFYKANLKKGQSVLIHSGTGGVGMAAIRLAQSRGLTVYTTCSSRKREYLKELFGLEDHQIGDSRSEGFVQTVLQGTNHRGVDAVVNQLSGPLQVATLRCVASGGDFCEIGKYDIMQNTALAQGLLAENISFHAIDLLPLLGDPANKPLWDEMLNNGFASGEIVPLPFQKFHCDDVENALRFMSQAKHKGKIIITGLNTGQFMVRNRCNKLASGKTHLITGGLGGLGLSIAFRLASNGCKRVYLVGRKGVTTGYQRNQIARMEKKGCETVVIKADLMSIKKEDFAEIDLIWHTATTYKDALLSEMTEEFWNEIYETKVKGYLHLRKTFPASRIVASSSVSAYSGNSHQTNYCFANATLDSLARNSSSNLLSIRLGALDNVGYITEDAKNRKLLEHVLRFQVMNIDIVLDSIMKLASENKSGVFGLYDFKKDFKKPNHGMNKRHTTQPSHSRDNPNVESAYTLKQAQTFIALVLGGKPGQYKANTNLVEAGLDSLSTMDVVNHIHDKSGKNEFKSSDINDSFTVQSLVDYIVNAHGTAFNRESDSLCTVIEEYDESTMKTDIKDDASESREDISDIIRFQDIHDNEESRTSVLTLKITPYYIDFSSLFSALKSCDILILRQDDPKVFNHGAPLDSYDEITIAKFMDNFVELSQAFESTNATVVVVVEGQVRGGGMLFPAVADLCLATEEATFGLPEIHRNMVPSVVSKSLVERIGKSTTRRLSLTGESFQADQALRFGLVDSILEASELDHYISSMVRRWEPLTTATKFIKNQLLPRSTSNSAAMGTVAGMWFMQRNGGNAIGNHDVLRMSIDDGVAILTMCDTTGQNTLSLEMSKAMRAAIPQLKKDAKVIILTSSLNHFHGGVNPAHAREWRDRPTCHVAAYIKECYLGFIELASLGLPIIAVMNGKVVGGGIPVSLWCDYRIATSDVDWHYGNISRGMSPACQLSQLLREYLSSSEIMEFYLENSHWNSEDLLQRKIVSSVATNKSQALSEAKKLALFIANKPSQGLRDTLHLVKLKYASEVANEEAWLLAQKITRESSETFGERNATLNESFVFDKGMRRTADKIESISTGSPTKSSTSSGYGIIAIEAYTPPYAIDAETLDRHAIENDFPLGGQGQNAVAVWDDQIDCISMALNAVSKLLQSHVADPRSIGRIEVGTESNVDMAKSVKSYLMDLFPSDHVNVEGVDNVNACYGGTAALLNTLSWCRETGGYGIVVCTDTHDVDLKHSCFRGASAVAMLVGPNPWVEIHPERASCFRNKYDFLKPRYSTRVSPFVDTKVSVNYYVEALASCIKSLRMDHSIDARNFDAFVFHGGGCVNFMKVVEKHLMRINGKPEHWIERFEQQRSFMAEMGSLCTASLYVNLLSLLRHNSSSSQSARELNNICLFGYGSCSAATLMQATIHHHRSHEIDLGIMIQEREMVSFNTVRRVVKSHETRERATILPKQKGFYYRDVSYHDSNMHMYVIQSKNESFFEQKSSPIEDLNFFLFF